MYNVHHSVHSIFLLFLHRMVDFSCIYIGIVWYGMVWYEYV